MSEKRYGTKSEKQKAYRERKKNLSGGVESRHAGYRRESSYSTDLSEPEGRENAPTSRPSSCTVEQLQGDTGSSAPPAQNNLPVPVLAEPMESVTEGGHTGEARESNPVADQSKDKGSDSCGGQTFSYDKKKYPNRQAWEIAVQRVERAIRWARKFPNHIYAGDLKFQTLDWQYENEGLKAPTS